MKRLRTSKQERGYNLIYKSIFLIYGILLTNGINEIFNYKMPFLRYSFATLSTIMLIRGVYLTLPKVERLSYLRAFYYFIFITYILSIILRGLPLTFSGMRSDMYLKIFLSGQVYIYLIPLLLYSEPNLMFLRRLFKLILWLALIYLGILYPIIVNAGPKWGTEIEKYGIFLASGSSILLLTLHYHSSRIKWTVLFIFVLAVVISALSGRRNQFIFYIATLLMAIFISIIGSSQMVKNRRLSMIGSFFIIIILSFTVYVVNSQYFAPFVERMGTGFESREVVIDEFIQDFENKPEDWAFGRGMNGEYYSTSSAFTIRGGRDSIENGYLNYILKGGYIYIGLIVILAFIAIYRGMFSSNNLLSKALASIILVHLIDMIGFGLPALSIKYIIVWIAIAFCLSSRIRSMPDDYIRHLIGLK